MKAYSEHTLGRATAGSINLKVTILARETLNYKHYWMKMMGKLEQLRRVTQKIISFRYGPDFKVTAWTVWKVAREPQSHLWNVAQSKINVVFTTIISNENDYISKISRVNDSRARHKPERKPKQDRLGLYVFVVHELIKSGGKVDVLYYQWQLADLKKATVWKRPEYKSRHHTLFFTMIMHRHIEQTSPGTWMNRTIGIRWPMRLIHQI